MGFETEYHGAKMELQSTSNLKLRFVSLVEQLPKRMTRITSGGKFIKEVDGLRFLAIMPVLIQHIAERFERNTTINFVTPAQDSTAAFLAARGVIGVYIFFMISGFILALPFATHKFGNGRKVELKQYYFRRITRLEPTYIIWITIFFLVFTTHGHSIYEYWPHYIANITYTHGLIYRAWSPINPPTWTLEIEIQFYILVPFLVVPFFVIRDKLKRRFVSVLAIFLIMVLQQYYKFYFAPYNLTILGHLHYFLAGFVLADIYVCDWKNITKSRWNDVVAMVAFGVLIFSWSWDFEFGNRIAFLISLFILFYAAFKSVAVNTFVTNRWVTAIGGMCYTIYLIHLPLSELLIRATERMHITDHFAINLLMQLLVTLPIILLFSSVFFLLFEKPFMDKNWPHKLSAKMRGVPLATGL